jgi:REP element-mobilizing transposase RayT
MARPPRIDIPGLTYHVTNRGVKRLAIFIDGEDRQYFLRTLLIVREQLPFVVQDYSLMTNHFHLLMKTLGTSLSQIMQCITSRYAYWFNRKYDQVGHAFQSRFHSLPVQTDAYLAEVCAYIDLNAPRARMVALPEDYPWCGYQAILSGRVDPIVDSSELLGLFSNDPGQARSLYRQFVDERFKKPEPLSHDELLKKRSWGELPAVTLSK